jgi:hypothetical protein
VTTFSSNDGNGNCGKSTLMKSLRFYLGSLTAILLILHMVGLTAQEEDERSRRISHLLRTGQYADARRLMDQMLAEKPSDDLKNVRAVLGGGPNMRVRQASAQFACEVRDSGVSVPLTINGRPVQWFVDTGANITLVSDAEATRLGLSIRTSNGTATDLNGGSTGVRTAIAKHLVIGRTRLDNVQLLVLPVDQMPWKELPAGKQGILGLPVVIALDALRWTRSGTCSTGSVAISGNRSEGGPLRYNGLQVLTSVGIDGRDVEFVLDSGDQTGTQLWERFGKEFDPLVKARGRPGSVRITQIGGSLDRTTTVLPDMRLHVGGKDTTLREAHLFSRPVGDDQFYGLLGMDVLSQAQDVTIDFHSMRLTLR